jgi:hypothetical protein
VSAIAARVARAQNARVVLDYDREAVLRGLHAFFVSIGLVVLIITAVTVVATVAGWPVVPSAVALAAVAIGLARRYRRRHGKERATQDEPPEERPPPSPPMTDGGTLRERRS